ncbi:MAG: DEAD/DEAH box helicase [Epsilonproteobacteria bacterium]|nr:DEAD/DEAH box helicase [Campylobacterota bacterium]
MKFDDFNLKKELLEAINSAGFKEPSPIQKEAIPKILDGDDLIAQAHTGTGKTAAFGLPILNMLKKDQNAEALIIVPTRELATQVSDEIYRFGKFLGVKTSTIYGGSSYERQIKNFKNSNVVVATPGRLIDLLKSKKIELSPRFVVLDEADEMLDMGFLDDIKEIFSLLKNKEHQTLMFSATMPKPIKELANQILKNPTTIKITQNNITNSNIKQNFYVVKENQRDDALVRLIDFKDPKKAIVFCRTRKESDRIANMLNSKGYNASSLHGDMSQREREEVMRGFRKGDIEILIATDVAARGLDVNDITHVFNYHIPFNSESYVHRIGRTARGGKEGVAISIVTPDEFNALNKIQKSVGSKLEAKEVPTIDDVYSKQQQNFIEEIKSKPTNQKAYELVQKLIEDENLNEKEVAIKLASMLLKNNKIKGANEIGLNLNEIEKLIKNSHKANKRRAKRRRKR